MPWGDFKGIMMPGIEISRTDLSAVDLRAASGRTGNVKAARRMLALALVLEGSDRETAARNCGMDRQTLRDWVHRYNAEGLAGLQSRKQSGPRPKLIVNKRRSLRRLSYLVRIRGLTKSFAGDESTYATRLRSFSA